MKKLLFVSLLIFVGANSYSQTEKGRMVFGVSQMSLSYNKSGTSGSSSKSTALSISPSVGRFLINNFLVGVGLGASFSKYKSSGLTTTNNSSYSIGPYAEYYFGSGLKGRPYVGVQSAYGLGHYEYTYTGGPVGKENLHNLNIGATGGYALFLNNSFMLRFEVGYNHSKNSYKLDNSSSSDNKNNRLFFGVGVLATFARD